MHLIRISLFLALFAVALSAGKDGDDIIGTDSDLVENVDVTSENLTSENVTGENVTGENVTGENVTGENVTGENVTGENVTGENVTGENVTGENVTGENVTGENVTDEEENVTKEKDVTKEQKDVTTSRRFLNLLPKKLCACFPRNPISKPISQVLNSRFERLVVYFYRNPVTNQIKIYVPNSARQIVFPDITYELGDNINILSPGAIDLIGHELGPVIQSWISVIHNKPIDKPDINFEIISQLDKNKIQSLLIYLKRFRQTRTILGKLTGLTLLDKLKQLKLLFPQIYANFLSKVTKFFPIWLNRGSIIRYKTNHLINFPYDINLIPVFQGKIIINGRPHYSVNEIIVYKPPNVDINVYYHDYIGKNIQLKIDSWLNVIISHLNKQLQFVSKKIDSAALKSVIISILQKNSISLTQSGLLVDVHGRSISYTNIILRPILIGESALVRRVINSGLFRIPSSIVFVEVALVSGGQLKSLGIIPVGNIFFGLKKVEISTVVEVIETTVVCEGGRCKTVKKCKDLSGNEIVCSNARRSGSENENNVIINSRNAVESDPRSGHNVVINSRDAVPNPLLPRNVVIQSRNDILSSESRQGCPNCIKCGSGLCAASPIYNGETSSESSSSDEPPGPIYRGTGSFGVGRSGKKSAIHFPNDNLYYARSGNIAYGDDNDIGDLRIVPGRPRPNQNSHVYHVVSEDVPGIRIIGGGAATGSGTPISSKG